MSIDWIRHYETQARLCRHAAQREAAAGHESKANELIESAAAYDSLAGKGRRNLEKRGDDLTAYGEDISS